MRKRWTVVLALAAVAFACSDGTTTPGGVPAILELVALTDTISALGGQSVIQATVLDESGRTLSVTPSWTNSRPDVLEMSVSGSSVVLTAIDVGNSTVTATVGDLHRSLAVVVDLGPASVVVVSGSVRESFGSEELTLHLRNDGNPGIFKLEAWGLPTSPGGPQTFYGETDPIEAPAGFDDVGVFLVNVGGTAPSFWKVKRVEVYTRDVGSLTLRHTFTWSTPPK